MNNINTGSTSTLLGGTAIGNYPIYPNYMANTTKEACKELYKQLLWYNIKKFGKDIFTEEQHKNMLSMLNSNDEDTLSLLRQILIGKALE